MEEVIVFFNPKCEVSLVLKIFMIFMAKHDWKHNIIKLMTCKFRGFIFHVNSLLFL